MLLELNELGATGWCDRSLNIDDHQASSFDAWEVTLLGTGETWSADNSDVVTMNPDPSRFMKMTLVVDMLD